MAPLSRVSRSNIAFGIGDDDVRLGHPAAPRVELAFQDRAHQVVAHRIAELGRRDHDLEERVGCEDVAARSQPLGQRALLLADDARELAGVAAVVDPDDPDVVAEGEEPGRQLAGDPPEPGRRHVADEQEPHRRSLRAVSSSASGS
jgi:hypothetical protein